MKTDTVFLNQWLAVEADSLNLPFNAVRTAMNNIICEDNARKAANKEAKRQMASFEAEYQFQRKLHENINR